MDENFSTKHTAAGQNGNLGQNFLGTSFLLQSLWAAQELYNLPIISNSEHPTKKLEDIEFWLKQYLLGAVSEVDEILNEINWKRHRKSNKTINKENLASELADLTKYVLCMWQIFDFSLEDMLRYCIEKSTELTEKYNQEMYPDPIPVNIPVIITDIDGTLGDWRTAFVKWAAFTHSLKLSDSSNHYQPEIDLGISYPTYLKLKEEFESTGQYQNLEPYVDALEFLRQAYTYSKASIIVFTARPQYRFSRIWHDTWKWLAKIKLSGIVRELQTGGEERVALACQLKAAGNVVLMLDDEPSWALRAAHTGITVLLRDQPYNQGISHPNIVRVRTFEYDRYSHFLRGDRP